MSPEPLTPEPLAPGPLAPARALRLGAEIAQAGRGILAVLRGDPEWARRFDLSTAGFLRSFLGPLLAAPFYVFASAMVTRAYMGGRTPPAAALWGAALAHGLDAVVFPLLIALAARPLRIAGGYAGFVIVTNWSSLFLNGLLAALSLLALFGHDGLQAFFLFTPVMLCISVFLVWRTGRVALSYEVGPVLLVVVLSVAVGAGAEKLVELIVSAA